MPGDLELKLSLTALSGGSIPKSAILLINREEKLTNAMSDFQIDDVMDWMRVVSTRSANGDFRVMTVMSY